MNSKEIDHFYSQLKEELNKDDDLGMPTVDTVKEYPDIHELLDNTDPKHIYLSSDWHFFKNHYKKEHNYVNTQKILTWCRQNIKEDDVFMYLSDISFRYANEEDQKESQRLLASIPGRKILILGNHDMMLGQDYFTGCGFHYVYERLIHNGILYTHKPENIEVIPDVWLNIHGHIHNIKTYNTTDGKNNINVYPLWYNGIPTTLDYCLKHKDKLVKDNERSDWTQIGESADYRDIEDLDINLEDFRDNLKNNQFGIPEDRKYPLDSKKHVMSAIKLFGHAEESKKKALAKRIKTAANKYDIKIPETTQVHKYLNESSVEKLIIPEGVENIIFDMGGVLVDDNGLNAYRAHKGIPDEYCEEIYKFIGEELFEPKNNKKMLYCDIQEARDYISSIAPEHIKPYIGEIFEAIRNDLFKFSYTDELIDACHSKGYKVYYLSNWEKCLYDIEHHIFDPLIEKFDGGLFSWECHIEKPSLSIYTLFIDKFKLEPDKCLFFDDKQENIDIGKVCGWNTVLWNNPETPIALFKALYKNSNVNIDFKKKFPIITDEGLRYINISNIKLWYVDEERHHDSISVTQFSDSLENAIIGAEHDSDFEEGNNYITKYVFTLDKNGGYMLLGSIMVFRDNTWEWQEQRPLYANSVGEIRDGLKDKVNEWAMASVNPVVGITKPYVLKMCNDCGGLINAKQYALATDLISDKYLVINENANLEIVNASNFHNMVIEEYEFVGDKRLIKKIEEAYYSGKVVDNTFFYTTLTGKPMLSEDQIDFDPNFKKVDFIAMKENNLTQLATLNEGYKNAINENIISVNAFPNNHSKQLLGNRSHITIMEDLDGYYVLNKEKNIRSASIEEQEFITEQMINSVL